MMSPRKASLALCILFLAGCGAYGDGSLPPTLRADGAYDNHVYLVNPKQMDLARVVDSIATLVTKTTFEDPEGNIVEKELRGSGVVIGERYILTVEHTVAQHDVQISTPVGVMELEMEKLAEKTFLRQDGKDVPLRVIYKDRDDDVALLELPAHVRHPSFPYVLGDSDDLKVGNFVYAIGNPLNMGINIREGIVSALHAPREVSEVNAKAQNAFMVSNGLAPGDSGSPVVAVRDGRYELVGLCQGTFVGNTRLGWVIRINQIRDLLRKGLEANRKDSEPLWRSASTRTSDQKEDSGRGFIRWLQERAATLIRSGPF